MSYNERVSRYSSHLDENNEVRYRIIKHKLTLNFVWYLSKRNEGVVHIFVFEHIEMSVVTL